MFQKCQFLKHRHFNIISCNRILQYETPTSLLLGKMTLVPTSGMKLKVVLPVLSSFHFLCHDLITIPVASLYTSVTVILSVASVVPLAILFASLRAFSSAKSLPVIQNDLGCTPNSQNCQSLLTVLEHPLTSGRFLDNELIPTSYPLHQLHNHNHRKQKFFQCLNLTDMSSSSQ